MGMNDEFTPEELSKQNEQLMRDLHHMYDSRAEDAQSLARIRKRLVKNNAIPLNGKTSYETSPMLITQAPMLRTEERGNDMKSISPRVSPGKVWPQRLSTLAAVLFVTLLVGSLILVLNRSHQTNTGGSPKSGQPTKIVPVTPISTPTSIPAGRPASTPTQNPVVFQVTAIDMTVQPASIAGLACGSNLTVTYVATFHAPAHSPGGTVQFTYTINNGRGSTPASLQFAPGETTKTYTFTSSGTLSPDNVYPGNGGVMTTSPNTLTSALVKPTGTCTQAAFQVTGVDLAVSPSSIAGMACNTSITLTYTATFHVAPGSPGGTIQFMWTANNGRSSTNASISFAPGETTKTYTFTVTGVLYSDHTFPGIAEVITTGPNTVNSPQVKPQGACQ